MAITCTGCGAKQGIMAALNTDLATGAYFCPACQENERRKEHAARAEMQRLLDVDAGKLKRAADDVILTTTPQVDGHYIKKYLGIESVEYVIGTGLFSEVTSEIADFFGQRSTAFEKKLQAAKKNVMDVLKYRAADRGANAVVGVDMDYAEFSGNRVALIVNGTLVLLGSYDEAGSK